MTLFALADCNNFYASCERVFNPKLQGMPVVVLSNNDGCVIARSNEAKALGIKMGVPYFEIKKLVKAHHIQVFSSNYTLYGDMSARVMSILAECVPELEVYSIDEAFLLLDGYPDILSYAREIKAKVLKWVGLPVSIGIGPTKTLAKLANYVAKKYIKAGVFSLADTLVQQRIFKQTPIGEVWGIGRRHTKSLNAMGVETVADFVNLDPALLRSRYNVTLLKTQNELKGVSCLELAEMEPTPQSITSSRSFGVPVTTLEELQEAITLHVAKIAYKLRRAQLCVNQLYIYAYNSRFSKTVAPRRFACVIKLPNYTNSTLPLLQAALKGFACVYEPGVIYKKAGAVAFDLVPEGLYLSDLWTPAEDIKQQRLSILMDEVNAKFGKGHIFHGSLGTGQRWLPKNMLKSAQYTTNYHELLQVT